MSARRLGLSTETPRLLEDMLRPAVRPVFARVPSAAMPRADRQGAIRRAEAPASVVEVRVLAAEALAAVAAGVGNPSLIVFLVDREIQEWREAICSEQSRSSTNPIGSFFLN